MKEDRGMYPLVAYHRLLKLNHAILEDLRTGYIANPSVRAEQRRRKYETQLGELLSCHRRAQP